MKHILLIVFLLFSSSIILSQHIDTTKSPIEKVNWFNKVQGFGLQVGITTKIGNTGKNDFIPLVLIGSDRHLFITGITLNVNKKIFFKDVMIGYMFKIY